MGYELHIHRKDNWFDEKSSKPVSYEEWKAVAKADEELIIVGSYGDRRVDFEIPIYGWPKPDGEAVSFIWLIDEVSVSFSGDAAIVKAFELSQKLGAKLQGDENEVYRADGSFFFEDPDDQAYYDNLSQTTEEKPRSFFSRLFKR